MVPLAMNQNIREAVHIQMLRRNIPQYRLAERVNVSRQYLNKLLKGHTEGSVKVWLDILNELDLELTVTERNPSRKEA